MRRKLVLALLVIPATPAIASFEMALVVDQNNGGRNWIHRYDVDSGVYLGRFDVGNASQSIVGMQLLSGQDRVSVASNGGWREYNIWTGEIVREIATVARPFAISDDGGKIAYFDGAVDFLTYDYPSFGSVATAGSLLGGVYRGEAFLRNTRTLMGMQVTSGGAQFGITSNLTGNATLLGSISGTFVDSRNIARAGSSGLFAIHNGTTVSRYAPSGSFVPFNVLTAPVVGWTPSALAEAHIGNLVLGRSAGVHGIARYGNSNSVDNRYFTTTQVVNGTHMAAFLAPEPGTMAALGLGAAALLRRKRKPQKSA